MADLFFSCPAERPWWASTSQDLKPIRDQSVRTADLLFITYLLPLADYSLSMQTHLPFINTHTHMHEYTSSWWTPSNYSTLCFFWRPPKSPQTWSLLADESASVCLDRCTHLWSFNSKCVHYLVPTIPLHLTGGIYYPLTRGKNKSLSREKTQGEGKIGNQREE